MDRQVLAGGSLAVVQQVTVGGQPAVSPALAAAQHKLDRLRQSYRQNQTERQTPPLTKVGRSQPPQLSNVHQARPKSLPHHLGWNSAPVTKAYRLALHNQARPAESHTLQIPPSPEPLPPPQPGSPTNAEAFLKLPPDMALAILRKKLASPGRIWLLLRQLDQKGQGWISAAAARQRLTGKQSPLAVCGMRQLRNLLATGDNIFWQRQGDRIWLKSMAKVAAVLGLTRLNGRPVKLPLSILLESIGTVRAHLYAAFHSSRSDIHACGEASTKSALGKPISRRTLKALSSATRRTQRLYEKRTGIRRQSNYAIGQPHTVAEEQNRAWQNGRAVFRFNDKQGLLGGAGQTYLAWQLPNSYDGPHEIQPKGYQRRINRQLADLLNEGITGNGEKTIDEPETAYRRHIFHRNGSTAAKIYNRSPDQALYWRSRIQRRRFGLWHLLPAVSRKTPQ